MKEQHIQVKRERPKGYVCQNIDCQKPIIENAETIRIRKWHTEYTCPHCGYKTLLTRDVSRGGLYEKQGGTVVRKGLKASELRKAQKRQRQYEYWKDHERMVKE